MTSSSQPYYLVIGLGTSGMSMARFLHARGKNVIATDMDPGKVEEGKTLAVMGITTQIGYHDQAVFDNAAYLVPSPGIPLTSKYIAEALKKGVPLTCELDVFSETNQLPVIAITGTNGKTTTTTLIGELLKACNKKVFVGGNIGTPLLEQPMSGQEHDIIVAEISSFQIDISRHFNPTVGLLLNISEDHLDRYKAFEAYVDSKWRLFANQSENNIAIINSDTPGFDEKAGRLPSKVLSFSSSRNHPPGVNAEISENQIRIRLDKVSHEIDTGICPQLYGIHNQENIAAAVLACLSLGADINAIKNGLADFNALPHRMEKVGVIKGVSFYNDSKATNTDAVIRALQCFDSPVFLILGGREKGTDFSQLVSTVKQRVKAVMAIGESKTHVLQTFSNICPVIDTRDMKDAVTRARQEAEEGDIVLLSPACASFDMYDSYAQRGNDFASIVKQMKEGTR